MVDLEVVAALRHLGTAMNVMRVIDGKIVEAAGYSKTAPIVAALES